MNNTEEKKIIGQYTYLKLKRNPDADELSLLRKYTRGDKNAIEGLRDLVAEEKVINNLVPTVGRNVFARLLTGDTTYSGEINYGAFGDGTSAFSNASTQLNNELYRKLISDSAFDNNIAYCDWFIASGDVADQTFEEFGAFIDGTGSADSGQAFSLVITGGWVKSGSMFISLKVTII